MPAAVSAGVLELDNISTSKEEQRMALKARLYSRLTLGRTEFNTAAYCGWQWSNDAHHVLAPAPVGSFVVLLI